MKVIMNKPDSIFGACGSSEAWQMEISCSNQDIVSGNAADY